MVFSSVIFAIVLILSSLIDINTKRIPNWLTIGGFIILFISIWLTQELMPLDFLISALISFLLMLSFVLLSKGKLGMGDAKLCLSIGGILGLYYWFLSILIASITGLIFALGFIKIKGKSKETAIAFAPFLSVGALVAWILKKEGLLVP